MTRIHNESVWTTVVTIQVDDDITDANWQSLLHESLTFLHDVDRVFSTFREDSFIKLYSKNPEAIKLKEISQPSEFRHYVPYVFEGFTTEALSAFEIVESLCVAAQWKTNGAFNAWRNNEYDPIGLVKGWAADEVLAIIRAYDVKQAFVNAGGDIACVAEMEPWRMAVENPNDTMTALGFLEIYSGALCTSGTYQKGQHIDTKTEDTFVSVTISGPSAALADAYATAAIADGLQAFEWIEMLGDAWGMIAMSGDGTMLYTHNWHLDDHEFKFQHPKES